MGRRFFITLGSGRYRNLALDEQLGCVSEDIRAATELFTGFGYQVVLPGLGEYDGADAIKQKLLHWSADMAPRGDDVVVLYFAGHGAVESHDRHYLLCWDSDPDNLAATALATEDLVRILGKGELRHLLVILDTCAGGAGSAEAAAIALQRLAYRNLSGPDSTGLWFLASARRKDIAEDGEFVAALKTAVTTTTERTGQRQQYLDLTELVKAVNERFEADGRGQRAELASGLVTGLAPFMPNVGYHPELPPMGTDLEIQRRVSERDISEHFGPRSRGVEFESEQGLYFSGRGNVLTELVGWLTAEDGDSRGRIVTGSPGCGKSAVLGRIVALSDPRYRAKLDLSEVDPATIVPENCVAAAVHARHKRLEEVVERIGVALGAPTDSAAALLQELTRRGRQGPPLVIVVDAVDEAGSDTAADAGGHGEPRRLSRELLRPMSEIQGVRLLVGTRHELMGALGPTFTHLDLDQPEYRAGVDDVAGYVTRVLLAAEEAEVRTPYRGQPELARTVAQGVAAKAAGVYLYARTTARTLRSDDNPVDVTAQGWADRLPSEIGGAFDDYLERFGEDEPRVRRMLLALAFSEGKGLPRGRVWTELSSVISGVPCTEADVSWVLDVAEAYIAEVVDDDRRSVYRLYHKALAEHLRDTADRPADDIQRSVVDALVSLVPPSPDGRPDWFGAVPYVSQHLATHAAAAGRLSSLMEDPGFLLACEPLALLRAFATAEGPAARRIRGAYEQVAHRLTAERPLGERAADLQLSARRCEADELADRVGRLGVAMPWSARWAWWSTSGVHRLLSGHTKSILCTAVGVLDGRPIAVTGSMDGTARIWDLVSQRQIGEPLAVGIAVSAIAIGELGDYTVALTGAEDGSIRVWDLSAGQEYEDPLTGHTNRVEAITVGALAGRPVVLTASADGTARLWDLAGRKQLGKELSAHRRTVNDVALGELDGRPIAVTGGDDQAMYVWDLSAVPEGGDARVVGNPLLGATGLVQAVSVTRLEDRAVAVVGDSSGLLTIWDLHERRQLGEPVMAHNSFTSSGVYSVTTGEFDGRPVALTSGATDVRLWDLARLQQIGQPLQGHVETITAAELVDRSGAWLAVTVSDDRTARVWDLTTEQPEAGHIREVADMAFCEVEGRPMLLTGGQDGSARFWDLRTREQAAPSMEGHSGEVMAVAVGQCDRRLVAATGGADTTVRLWNPMTGEPGPVLSGHTNVVTCVAIGALDGTPVVVSGSEDGTVRIWDARSGAPVVAPIAGHIGGVRHLAVREAGAHLEIVLATYSGHCYFLEAGGRRQAVHLFLEDYKQSARSVGVGFHGSRPTVLCSVTGNDVHMLDVTDKSLVAGPFRGHTSPAWQSAMGRVGDTPVLATLSGDNTLRLWDLETGAAVGRPMEGEEYTVKAAPVFGRIDGVPVVLATHSQPVRIWNAGSMRTMGEPLCGRDWRTSSVEMFEDVPGRVVVATEDSDGVIRVHALDDGRQVADQITARPGFGHGIAIAPGRPGTDTLLVRGGWRQAEVWSLKDGERRAIRQGAAERPCAHLMGDKTVVLSVGDNYEIHAWDLETQAPVCPPMKGHTASVTALRVWNLKGVDLAVSASYDGTVRLWELATGQPWGDPLPGHEMGATSLSLGTLDRDVVVAGAGDGRLHFWDLADRRRTAVELAPFLAEVTAIRAARIDDTPTLVAGDRYGQLRVWDTRSASWTFSLDVGSGICDIALDDHGRICVATDMGVVALQLDVAGRTAKEGIE